jgi:CRISPR/Cas system-associated protein Cas10 (large subunit of type III CRISPR-Cas system)
VHNFLYLILEGLAVTIRKPKKARAVAIKKVARGSNWNRLGAKRRYKKLLPRQTSLFGTRTLTNQTDKTRPVWDPKGYKSQKFYDNTYRTI